MSPSKTFIVALLVTACVGQSGDGNTAVTTLAPVPTTATSTAPETTTTTTSSLITTTQPPVEGCAGDRRFIEGGLVQRSGTTSSDTTTVGLIHWEAEDACEIFEIAFETAEGAPATTPPEVTAGFVGGIGVLRLSLRATDTVIADQRVETDLVDHLYVVRALDGSMFIDFHLTGPTQARIEVESSPALLRLHLQPGLVDFDHDPAASNRVVLLAPAEESTVSLTVTVEGYARTFESNVLVIATQGDDVVAEEQVTAADGADTWGEFRIDLDLVPGPIVLFVGEEDAESGRFEGVSIDFEAR